MKDTWWFHPFITVDERISSWVAVDKNGCNSAFDGNNDSSLSIPFGDVESHELEQIEDCLWRLNIETEDSIVKPISLDEYVPEGAGPYLKMLDAMLDVYMPVINASRGKPFWLHGAGGEGYQMFDSWEELLRDDGKWETAHRPKMGTVGELLGDVAQDPAHGELTDVAEMDSHQASVRGALLLSDGSVLSWSDDTTLKIWDTTTGTCSMTLNGHTGRVVGALLLSSGDVLSWSTDCSLRVWNLSTGISTSSATDECPISGAVLLPDGAILYWSKDDSAEVGTFAIAEPDLSEVRGDLEGHEYPVEGALLLSDKRVLSWSQDCTLKIWNVESAEILQTFHLNKDAATTGVLAPDGARELANGNILTWQHTIFGGHSSMKIWVPATGECVKTMEAHDDLIAEVCVVDDSSALSCSHDGTVCVWDLNEGVATKSIELESGAVYGALQVSRKDLIAWCADGSLGRWNGDTGEWVGWLVGHEGAVVGALLLPHGHLLSWSEDRTLRVWNLDSGVEHLRLGVAKAPERPEGDAQELYFPYEDDGTIADADAKSSVRVLPNGVVQAGTPAGDMLVDFLVLAGVWPTELDPMTCRDDEVPLPAEVLDACQRLFDALKRDPNLWLEVPQELGVSCSIVDDDPRDEDQRTRVGILSIDCLDELPGVSDYPWDSRGPLWYSSGLTINSMYTGPILFVRDGWVGVDPDDSERFTLNSWDGVHAHVWPHGNLDGDAYPTLMKLGDVELDYDAIRAPTWAALSFQLADIILRRILPAARRSRGKLGITTPPIGQWTEERIKAILTGEG